MLAPDVVIVYEYNKNEKRFLTPPDIAGRLIFEQDMSMHVYDHNVPNLLINHGINIYTENSVQDDILNPTFSIHFPRRESFVNREKIASSCGILLKAGEEIFGAMFINYRQFHIFSDEEKKIIETLALSAAIALRNRRLLGTFHDIDREIITTLEFTKVLNLVVERAVRLMRADLGTIGLYDPISQELVVEARHPSNVPFASGLERLSMAEGISGWVASQGQSALVEDVEKSPRYQAYFHGMCSVLCVPLLDGERCTLGVLNVESRRPAAFKLREQRILEALANQAVIAIQNAKSQRRFLDAERMATLGDLASNLVHWMYNDIGAIRVFAQDMQEVADENTKSTAREIQILAERLLLEASRLKGWIPSEPCPVDLRQALDNALKRVRMPSNIGQHIDIPSNLPTVIGGEDQLIEVFFNLLQNAVDAMPKGGKLSIHGTKSQEGDWVVIRVHDTGTGIPKEDLPKIFQCDYKRKTAAKTGLGFGLWWVRTYVERLGGHLNVDSQYGEWTEFTVTLACTLEAHA